MAQEYNDEPVIEVTATPIGGKPQKTAFSFSTASVIIAGSTVPIVAKKETATAVDFVTMFVDEIKNSYKASEHKLVIKMREEWMCHLVAKYD